MTREEIERMPAGREMDRLIAEKVMGWKSDGSHSSDGLPIYHTYQNGSRDVWLRDWKPSSDIAAAWQVAEKLRNEWGSFDLRAGLQWFCWSDVDNRIAGEVVAASADTASLAICRAALIEMLLRQPCA